MLELILKVLIQGIVVFIQEGTSHLRYSIAISIFMALLFSVLTYYFPFFWNKKYLNTKLCMLLAFFSFILTAITTFIICTLSFLSTYFAEQLNEQIGFSIGNTILSITMLYLLLQSVLFSFLSIAAYKDIKVFS